MSSYAEELGENPSIVEECKGSDLVGQAYYPIFEYFVGKNKDQALGSKAWTIISGDFGNNR